MAQWRRLLGAYDYRRQLERGYSVTRDGDGHGSSGRPPSSPPGRRLLTRLADGEVASDGLGSSEPALARGAPIRPVCNQT